MDVRLHTVADLDEALGLVTFLDRCLAEMAEPVLDGRETAGLTAPYLERVFAEPETILVTAKAGGPEPIGACLIGPWEEPLLRRRTPFVHLLWVHPDHRHRGLASHLLDDALAELSQRGFSRLAGRAGQGDDALVSMGERWGFVRRWEWMVLE